MICFKPDVRIIDIYSVESGKLSINFNTKNNIIAPKSILDLICMFNGQFNIEHIINRNVVHMDIDLKRVLNMFINWGIIHESFTDFNNKYIQAKDKLSNYIVHFPRMSNINIMIAVLLYKMRVKTIFYENGIITKNDVYKNIYYKFDDIEKDIGSFIQYELKIDTVSFLDSGFNSNNLNENIDIIVNSDVIDWASNGNGITINTWNYKHTHFNDFKIFNEKINLTNDINMLVEDYILAVRSVDDMLYSITGALFF